VLTFEIVVDLTAPQVTWGTVAGTNAGELLQAAYMLDEPEAVGAELVLADGRHLAMTVLAGRVEVLLPPDTPDGEAIIKLGTRDDVDNVAVFQRAVQLHSVMVPIDTGGPTSTGAPTPTGGPGPAPTPPPQVKTAVSRAILASSYLWSAVLPSRATASASSRWDVDAALIARARSITRSRGETAAVLSVQTARSVVREELASVQRRDGPDLEMWLMWELLS
jgi:hypothetical protein